MSHKNIFVFIAPSPKYAMKAIQLSELQDSQVKHLDPQFNSTHNCDGSNLLNPRSESQEYLCLYSSAPSKVCGERNSAQ